jgi:mono/diheme cytochrome c family protein
MKKQFLGGAVTSLLLAGVGVAGMAWLGLIPSNADSFPSPLEHRLAHIALDAWTARNTPQKGNPLPVNEADLVEGMKLYQDNCMACHGEQSGKPSLGPFYPPAPIFTKGKTPDDPDGELHTTVSRGIRMTGMPAFGNRLKDEEIWKTVMFIKNLNSLPPTVEEQWKPTQ